MERNQFPPEGDDRDERRDKSGGQPAPKGVSTDAPAEGADDTPPPLPGSPRKG